MIDEGTLRAGAKLPSIRQFRIRTRSACTRWSMPTTAGGAGFFASRPHSGFFVRSRATGALAQTASSGNYTFDSMWYMRRIFENRALLASRGAAGCPMTGCSAKGSSAACAPWRRRWTWAATANQGLPPLRQLVRDLLAEQEVVVPADQVLLTQGSSQAGPGGAPAGERGRLGAGGRAGLRQPAVLAALPARPPDRRTARRRAGTWRRWRRG